MDKAIFSVGKNNDIYYAVIPESHPFFDHHDVVHPSMVSICGDAKIFNQYHSSTSTDTTAELASLTVREVEVDSKPLWVNHFRSEKLFLPKRHSYRMALRPLPSRSPSDVCDEEPLFPATSGVRDYGSRRIHSKHASYSGASALMKASHLLSDAVYFIGNDVDLLLAQYTSWMSECAGRLADEQLSPFVRVIVVGQGLGYSSDDLRSRFRIPTNAGARMDMHVFDSMKPIASLAAYDARCGLVRRRHLGQCWTASALQMLLQASIQAFGSGAAKFSFVDALAGGAVVGSVDDGFWEDTLKSYGTGASTPLLASYIAHHILREHRHSDPMASGSGAAAADDRGSSLVDHIIELRYKPWISRLHPALQDEVGPAGRLGCEIKQRMRAYTLGPSPLESHVAHLNDHRLKLQTHRPKYACVACFFSAWADLLPCGHGLCHRCSHRLVGGWRKTGMLRIDSCPVCLTYFGNAFYTSASPPTAGGRVLSLDGGGVKVVVLLKVLDQLGKMISPEVEISSLFDLAVGTSAGGLVALALSVKQWSVEECQNKITRIARSIFPGTGRVGGALDKYCCGWFTPLRRLLRCAATGSIYNKQNVERVLQTELGDLKMLESQKSAASGPMMRAAVTTENISRGHRVELITTYNKRGSPNAGADADAYRWLQADEAMSDIRTFKAACCTSAATVFFPWQEVAGSRFQDAAMQCNDPQGIAAQEAALMWAGRRSLVLSVGCGRFRDSEPSSSCYGRFAGSFKKAMSTPRNTSLRLDPSLDMDEVMIDAADRIHILDSMLPAALLEDFSLQDNLLSAAWKVIASQFYVEMMPELSYSPVHGKYRFVGIVRCRNPHMTFLQRHKVFRNVRFRINKSVEKRFRCPLRFSFDTDSLDAFLHVELVSGDPPFEAPLSGLPNTVSGLADLQLGFSYPLSGASGKRKRQEEGGVDAKRRRT